MKIKTDGNQTFNVPNNEEGKEFMRLIRKFRNRGVYYRRRARGEGKVSLSSPECKWMAVYLDQAQYRSREKTSYPMAEKIKPVANVLVENDKNQKSFTAGSYICGGDKVFKDPQGRVHQLRPSNYKSAGKTIGTAARSAFANQKVAVDLYPGMGGAVSSKPNPPKSKTKTFPSMRRLKVGEEVYVGLSGAVWPIDSPQGHGKTSIGKVVAAMDVGRTEAVVALYDHPKSPSEVEEVDLNERELELAQYALRTMPPEAGDYFRAKWGVSFDDILTTYAVVKEKLK
jgi:hypothetical protein